MVASERSWDRVRWFYENIATKALWSRGLAGIIIFFVDEGLKSGHWVAFDKLGIKIEEGDYKDGKPHGKLSHYYKTGQCRSTFVFIFDYLFFYNSMLKRHVLFRAGLAS